MAKPKKTKKEEITVTVENIEEVFEAVKRTSKGTYSVVLNVSGKEHKGKGNTFKEALLSIDPGKLTTKGVLDVSKGKKKAQLLLNIVQMRKMFGVAGQTTQDIVIGFFSNRVEFLLK